MYINLSKTPQYCQFLKINSDTVNHALIFAYRYDKNGKKFGEKV